MLWMHSLTLRLTSPCFCIRFRRLVTITLNCASSCPFRCSATLVSTGCTECGDSTATTAHHQRARERRARDAQRAHGVVVLHPGLEADLARAQQETQRSERLIEHAKSAGCICVVGFCATMNWTVATLLPATADSKGALNATLVDASGLPDARVANAFKPDPKR